MSVYAYGGSGDFGYQWSNGQSGTQISDLPVGYSEVTVTDIGTGCQTTLGAVLMDDVCAHNATLCARLQTGAVVTSASNGTANGSVRILIENTLGGARVVWPAGLEEFNGHIARRPDRPIRYNPTYDGAAADLHFNEFYQAHPGAVSVLKGIAPQMRGITQYPGQAPEFLEQKPYFYDQNVYEYNGSFDCYFENGQAVRLYPSSYYYPPGYIPPDEENPGQGDVEPALMTDPLLYLDHAKWNTIHAIKYGNGNSTDLSDYLLAQQLLAESEVNDGLHKARLLYLENNNEPDKSWYEEAYDFYSQDEYPNNPDLSSYCDQPYDAQARMNWHFAPEAYAAMLSADYDGHQRSPGFLIDPGNPGLGHWGVKNHIVQTDDGIHQPGEIRVAMAGLASLRTTYVERMMAWCVANRTGNGPTLPWEVFNFHHYSSEWSMNAPEEELFEETWGIPLANIGQHGVSPERDDLRGKMSETISRTNSAYDEANVANAERNNKEFWLSEFGYDTNARSNQRVPPLSGNTLQETQAQWIVRSILEASAARAGWGPDGQEIAKGFDKVHIFCIRDEDRSANNEAGGYLYGSSGLVEFDFTPKRSWYYVMSLLSILGEQEYLTDLNPASPSGTAIAGTSDPQTLTRVLAYSDGQQGGTRTLAVWAPTSQGAGQEYTYSLEINSELIYGEVFTINTATLVTLTDGDEDGVREILPVSNNTLQVPVSERPVFILLNESIEDAPLPCVENLTVTTTGCDYVRLDWDNPTEIIYDEYEIFYSPSGLLEAFDASHPATTLGLTISGSLDNAVIAGLDDCSRYDFYVRGVVRNAEGVRTGSSQVCSPDFSRLTRRCDGCTIPTSALSVQLIDNNGAGYTITDIEDVILTSNSSDPEAGDYDRCGLLNTPVSDANFIGTNPGWFESSYHPDGDVVQIDFDESYYLNALYFLMGNGNSGTISVQIQQNGTWTTITTLENRKYYQWDVQTAFDHNLPIGSLRLVKEDGTAHLARLLFCGRPVGDGLQGPQEEEEARRITENGGSIDAVTWQSDGSATIKWSDPAPREQYLIRYGEPSPETDLIEEVQFEREIVVENPKLNYSATIEAAGQASATGKTEIWRCLCPQEGEELEQSFGLNQATPIGTSPPPAEELSVPQIGADPDVTVSPNPARDRIRVQLGNTAYKFYRLVGPGGRVVRRGRITEPTFALRVEELPAGLYRLHLISLAEEYSHYSVVIE